MQMKEEYNDIDGLITSYLSGNLDKASFSELQKWTMESEANRIYVRNKLNFGFLREYREVLNHLMKMRLLLCFSSGQLYSRKKKSRQDVLSLGKCYIVWLLCFWYY